MGGYGEPHRLWINRSTPTELRKTYYNESMRGFRKGQAEGERGAGAGNSRRTFRLTPLISRAIIPQAPIYMKNLRKHTLYLIGGLSRAGKTTVLKNLMGRRPAITIQTDAIRNAIRKVLVGEAYVAVKDIKVSTRTTFHRPGNLKKFAIARTRHFKGEDEFTWAGVLGLIEAYDRKNKTDVIIEGVAITPQKVHALKLKNLRTRAAFVGYSNTSHLQTILAHSAAEKDWIQTSIKEHGGGTSHLTKWFREEVAKGRRIQKFARKFHYGYFDAGERPFRQHVAAVVAYLLKK